jgi:DNA mismatch endonuclease (patch repair protein)
MARIKSKQTNFEMAVFSELRSRGLKFVANYPGVVGKPDIAAPKLRRAVFLHSDFWHGWRLPCWIDILPNDFWREKLRKNRRRDQSVLRKLRRQGWQVIVVWEHQIRRDRAKAMKVMSAFLLNGHITARGRLRQSSPK